MRKGYSIINSRVGQRVKGGVYLTFFGVILLCFPGILIVMVHEKGGGHNIHDS